MLLLILLSLLSLVCGSYIKHEFTSDGQGNAFLFPQMTACLSNGDVVVYHYNVNGIEGQSGLSIIDRDGNHVRSITTILNGTDSNNQSIGPIGQFVNDPFLAYYPYAADHMYAYFDQSINREVIEMVIPIEKPIRGGVSMTMNGMLIDTNGVYIRSLSINQSNNQLHKAIVRYENSELTLSHVSSARKIVIGGINQSMSISINLTDFWQQAQGRMTLAANMQTFQSIDQSTNQPINQLVVLLDDSQQAYPYVSQMLFVFDPLTGQLIDMVDPMITYDTNQLVVYGRQSITIGSDQSIIIVQPSSYSSQSIYLFTKSSINQSLLPLSGQVSTMWYTGLGYLQGQASLSDSCIATTTVSATNLVSRTQSIVILSFNSRTVLSTISTITGITDTALSAGASQSINDYLFTSIYADSLDRLFLTNFYQDGYSQGVAPGVLILSRSGVFLDWYPGFELPQSVSLNTQGHMLVPDRWAQRLIVIDLTTRTQLASVSCGGCLGIIADTVYGGYIVTTSNSHMNSAAIEFMDSNYVLDRSRDSVQFGFWAGYSDQAALSNPQQDSTGRIFVSVSTQAGHSRSTSSLHVYNPVTRQLIISNDWANQQPRGIAGNSQLSYGLSITMDRQTQSIIQSTIDYGQIFMTKPF